MNTTTKTDSSASPVAPGKAATPLMQQYLAIKQRYPDEILFFRLGDFYEMFFEDAVRAAPILEVALTQRQSIPMCGIPHHAVTSYLAKLIRAGVSVAMAEQLEDPKKTKGMVKRDVVRVVTPGTLVEDELLPSRAHNFLVALAMAPSPKGGGRWALAAADVSTGRQWIGEAEDDQRWNALRSQLAGLSPSEILVVGNGARSLADVDTGRAVVRFEPAGTESGLTDQTLAAVRRYLTRDHAQAVKSLQDPQPLPLGSDAVLFLDETAIRHLELVAPADPTRSSPTLLSILDRAVTPLGSRMLRWWLLHPSLHLPEINGRLDQVGHLVEDALAREKIREGLNGLADIERISVRSQAGTASPRDLDALRQALLRLPSVAAVLTGFTTDLRRNDFAALAAGLAVPAELVGALERRLAEEPPSKLIDGGVIRDGVSPELDELRNLRRSGKKWIAEMETSERERTGIGSLKVGYNDVFGFYIEVSKSNLSKVPEDWIRKQTLANGERYITPALKEQEEKILGAEEKIRSLEAALFAELVLEVASFGPSLARLAEGIARLDAVASLSDVASENHWVRPVVDSSSDLDIKAGRHPVIERQIGRDRFIPNDLVFDPQRRIALITGPNMAGKSTYLRQTALIVILAQTGCFVPAHSARIGLVDKIFTRIGASDRLSQGQSTFMVEMQEVATLLRNATPRSLLVLDEVGRGTSTYDGVSIAWAVVEHLTSLKSPRTLFATHYFELTQLEGRLSGVFNAHATAKEWPGADGRRQVVFLYQILPGAADRSYGIHVAEMAGLPETCIDQARTILKQLESGNHEFGTASPGKAQLEFFAENPLVEELRNIRTETMTPLEALNKLAELKRKAGE